MNLEFTGATRRYSHPPGFAWPALAPGEVHVWRIDLTAGDLEHALSRLDALELARAQRFAFARDCERYIRAHAAQREIIAAYTGIAADEIMFAVNAHGKPRCNLAGAPAFNLSHSGDIGVLAIGMFADIGIDVEVRKPPCDVRKLAESVLSPQERDALAAVSESGLEDAFLTCWTRKEACLKALGIGLELDPSKVTVGLASERSAIEIEAWGDVRLDVQTIISDDRYLVSLAVIGGRATASVFDHVQSEALGGMLR